VIYIGMVQMSPRSRINEPWKFHTLDDAIAFSRISYQKIFAAVAGRHSVWEIWPGGRMVEYKFEILMEIQKRKDLHAARKKAEEPA
jgi:hypothetical protein